MLTGASLDVHAFRNLRLNAELVTLSGRETPLGPQVRGEGVIGAALCVSCSGCARDARWW